MISIKIDLIAMAILITEFVVLILRLWIVRDDYNFKDVFCDVPKYFLIGIITLIAGMLMPKYSQKQMPTFWPHRLVQYTYFHVR